MIVLLYDKMIYVYLPIYTTANNIKYVNDPV